MRKEPRSYLAFGRVAELPAKWMDDLYFHYTDNYLGKLWRFIACRILVHVVLPSR